MLWQLKNDSMLWAFLFVALLAAVMFVRGKRWPETFSLRKVFLYTLGLSCAVLALSRPQLGKQIATERGAGNNIFIAIDISKSMTAEDLLPNRLQFSVSVIERILPEIEGARVALFPFSADGYIQVPLSYDIEMVSSVLPAMEPSLSSDQGTNYTVSLQKLYDVISRMEKSAIERGDQWLPTQIILLSDGETHEEVSDSLLARFEQSKYPIFTIGTATLTGAPVPDDTPYAPRNSYMRDSSGQVVTSRLNRNSLSKIASLTGGQYFEGNLRSVRKLTAQLTKSSRLSKVKTQMKVEKELYPTLFLIAVLILLTEFCFGRWHYVIRTAVLLLCFLPNFSHGSQDTVLLQKLKEAKDSETKAVLTYNLGVFYRSKKENERAAEYFQEAAYLSQDKTVKKKALFNLGNSLLESMKPKEAIEKYQASYEIDTETTEFDSKTNTDLSANMELAARIQQQMEKQQQQQKGDGEGDPKKGDDPQGPKSDYLARQFSQLRKQRIFDLLSEEEQETLKSLREKRNKQKGIPQSGKQW